MRFWDASAVIPLLLAETSSEQIQELLSEDMSMLVWWGCEIECVSALARSERANVHSAEAVAVGYRRLAELSADWHEVEPGGLVREAAARFLRVHALRAADALQLAAAFVASDRRPAALEFVTLDTRLAAAARKEGFAVIDLAPAD